MTLRETADRYGMQEDELKELLLTDDKNVRFFKNHPLTGELDTMASRAIIEILEKSGRLPSVQGSAFDEPDEKKEDSAEEAETVTETSNVQENADGTTNTEPETNNELPRPKRASARPKKKPAPVTEIESDIDAVPSMALRKFYAENFNVKPEKIFFMDDASVKEKIDEKYLVMERSDDYLFLKRTTGVLFMKKD